MPQHDLILDNGSGAAFRADANNALEALGSSMKGPNAPPVPLAGMVWLDDDTPSASIWTLKMYDGADWTEIGRLNVTTNIFTVAEGSFAPVDIASAATTDIGASASPNVRVTGTAGITSLGTAPAGTRRFVTFAGVLNITYNATSLQTPGLASITTAAGDNMVARSLGSGNWVIESYTRAAGLPALQGAVTGSGLTMATARLLGRTNAGTGAPQEISIGGGLTLTGGVLTGARQPAAAGDGVWAAQEFNSAAWVLPAGGTYAYIVLGFETSPRIWSGGTARFAGVAAGGTTVVAASTGVTWWGMYWRIA